MPLLDMRGNPIESLSFARPKKGAVVLPKVGDTFGQWAGRDNVFTSLPGGGVLQFDLSRLTLTDFRSMRQNYQLGASLNVLAFIMHQMDWHIECEKKEIAEFIEEDMRTNWTSLIRGVSQAFWAGYAPTAVNYRNDTDGKIRIHKFKDLVPEECRVKWNKTKGWAPVGKPKPWIYSYDGFFHNGLEIPVENSFWYPLLMENGDHYGRKLLKPAFPPWFFSNLMHLFANRYFERFGEPLPIGRGRFDDDVDMGGETGFVSGKRAMEIIVQNIRNRAVVVLPSDRDPVTKEYDYDLEYLESQMRGADFERYLARLDEEMSLAVFTPMLLFRTASVGSYNLGEMHMRVFQQQLNAISGDMQFYFQNYLVDRLRVLNFGQTSPLAKWVYRKQGQGNIDQFKELMVEMVRQGIAKPDYTELGSILGLKFEEVEQIVAPPAPAPGAPPAKDGKPAPKPKPTVKAAKEVMAEAATRAAREVGKGNLQAQLGFKNRFRDALVVDGFDPDLAYQMTTDLYSKLNTWLTDAAPVATDGANMKQMLCNVIDAEMSES